MYIRITKEFQFEMAHALTGHDGPCRNIHGHSYQLAVTIKGIPMKDPNNPKTGMVADFSDIKNIVFGAIVQPFDHALVLNRHGAQEKFSGLLDQKLILVDFQPTCENLLIYFVKELKELLPDELVLHHLLLRETSTSYAEWHAEDNASITA
jgi:6-pyruvoyltetrahydropterin/6-carboxytetrahydropterin synthase